MSSPRRAQLFLPTPLGLVEYDVLEDAVFLGPAKRGGVTAAPAPFKEATLALTAEADGFVARALPGEAPARVNGEPAGDKPLSHGDKIDLGSHTVLFRTRAVKVPAAAAAAPAPAAPSGLRPRQERTRRTPQPLRTNPWITGLAIVGGLIVLVAVKRAVDHLTDLRAAEQVRVEIPEPPTPPSAVEAPPERSAREYAEIAALELREPVDLDAVIFRYREFIRRLPESADADRARARITELMDTAGTAALAALQEDVTAKMGSGRFESALIAIRKFERKYGATTAGQGAEPLYRLVNEEARKAVDRLLVRVRPMVATDPRAAHRELLASGLELPPDLAGEVSALMERAIQIMKSQGRPPPEPRVPPDGGDTGAGPEGGEPPPPTPPPTPPSPLPPDDGTDPEAAARRDWAAAHRDLVEGRYPDALQAYTLLAQRHGNTDTYRRNRQQIAAGRRAAKLGAQGPTGLFSIPVDVRRGRIEVEYVFDDARLTESDFTREQPFPSDQPVRIEAGGGVLHMSGASGFFHIVVWEDDVHVEADITAEIARDIGILAVEDSDDFRAVMLNLGNTLFSLKKGAAARVQPGHLLWFVGEGVWADADEDALGFIKIAERNKSEMQNGDRFVMEFIRRGDEAEGGFQSRNDGASLRGRVRGDDGRGMGSARVGLFTNTGALVLHRIKITGKVDEAWFAKHLAELIALDAGPR